METVNIFVAFLTLCCSTNRVLFLVRQTIRELNAWANKYGNTTIPRIYSQ